MVFEDVAACSLSGHEWTYMRVYSHGVLFSICLSLFDRVGRTIAMAGVSLLSPPKS